MTQFINKIQETMTYKEKIIAEINRLKLKVSGNSPYHCGCRDGLMILEAFINFLPAEQPSEDLDVEINLEYKSNYKLKELTLEEFRTIVYYFANWQKQQIINKACEWLNKNVVEYHPRKGELRPIVNINAFREAMEKEDEQ